MIFLMQGTLAGNALSLAAMRASLEHVLTEKTYDRACKLAQRFVDGVEKVIKENNLPWHINILGCRAGKELTIRNLTD